eukprot:gene1723-2894_t
MALEEKREYARERRDTLRSMCEEGGQANQQEICTILNIVIQSTPVTPNRNTTIVNLLSNVREAGRYLKQASPYGMLVANLVRRFLFHIREEFANYYSADRQPPSTSMPAKPCPFGAGAGLCKHSNHRVADFLGQPPGPGPDGDALGMDVAVDFHTVCNLPAATLPFPVQLGHRRQPPTDPRIVEESGLLDLGSTSQPTHYGGVFPHELLFTQQIKDKLGLVLADLVEEIQGVYKDVAELSTDHIVPGEIILTFGYSKTVSVFLRTAARKIRFDVFVVEGHPQPAGHRMAKELTAAGISTTVIPDSNIYAFMSRVDKVFMGTYGGMCPSVGIPLSPSAVLANGGIVGPAGSLLLIAQQLKLGGLPVKSCHSGQ